MVTNAEFREITSRKLTKKDIENILGVKMRKIGNDYVCQCPICQDSGCDNLHFKEGEYLKCFSCAENEGASYVYKLFFQDKKLDIDERKDMSKPMIPIECKVWYKKQEEYILYMADCNEYLLNNDKLLKELELIRGLKKSTIERVGMGFDVEKQQYVIPIFSQLHDGMITDFELRTYNRAFGKNKVVMRKGGGDNTIASIGKVGNGEKLLITEGFLDGYILLQFMLEKKQTDFSICSCSNGVNSLKEVIGDIDFTKYSSIKLILDNDKAGNDTVNEITKKFSFIQDGRDVLKRTNTNDINEWYLKLISKNR